MGIGLLCVYRFFYVERLVFGRSRVNGVSARDRWFLPPV
jgi:hypothetical protein